MKSLTKLLPNTARLLLQLSSKIVIQDAARASALLSSKTMRKAKLLKKHCTTPNLVAVLLRLTRLVQKRIVLVETSVVAVATAVHSVNAAGKRFLTGKPKRLLSREPFFSVYAVRILTD